MKRNQQGTNDAPRRIPEDPNSSADENSPRVETRRPLLASKRAELLEAIELVVGRAQILNEDAMDRAESEWYRDLGEMLASAREFYTFVKQTLDRNYEDIPASQFDEQMRGALHNFGNRLNRVSGLCQFLLMDENQQYFGAYADELECILAQCKRCESSLHHCQRPTTPQEFDDKITPYWHCPEQDVLRPADSVFSSSRGIEPAHVLIADDSTSTRDLIERFLVKDGHRVTCAANGQETLQILQNEQFDLILLDVMMPGMSGFEVLRTLKMNDSFRHIPVIMISALDAMADITPCIELGADDFLTKPVDFRLLKARASSSLDRKRLREREFGQFFTPELARFYVRHPELITEGREADVTVLFCDIRGFSRISARLGPAETVSWVGDVMNILSDCVSDHDGVLVDYIGDELMAMWGAPEPAPDHADLACRAAVDMIGQLPGINQRWRNVVKENTCVGIGISSGTAQVGNTGSQRKFKYGPLGNTVNLASRAQCATKYLATPILVTGATRSRLAHDCAERRLGKVRVFNIEEPVELFEFLPDKLSAAQIDRYEVALDCFERQRLTQAAAMLGALLAEIPDDRPSLMLMSRVVESLLHRPEHFDPVWDLPRK